MKNLLVKDPRVTTRMPRILADSETCHFVVRLATRSRFVWRRDAVKSRAVALIVLFAIIALLPDLRRSVRAGPIRR